MDIFSFFEMKILIKVKEKQICAKYLDVMLHLSMIIRIPKANFESFEMLLSSFINTKVRKNEAIMKRVILI